MARKSVRNNAGRFQKYASVYIDKNLRAITDGVGTDVEKIIADKLKECYKTNIEKSYTPKTTKGFEVIEHNKDPYNKNNKKTLTYHHTNTLVDNIDTVVENHTVKAVLKDVPYKDGKKEPRTTIDVYKYLTEGTGRNVGQAYLYKTAQGGLKIGRNYPTEIHEFEEWTQLEMKGFLETLPGDLKNRKKEYMKYRYTGKKAKRKTYKGQEVI